MSKERVTALLKNPGFIFKLIEFVLGVTICILVAVDSSSSAYLNENAYNVTIVTAGGYTLITTALIIMYLAKSAFEFFELLTLPVGGVLYLAAATLGFIHVSQNTQLCCTLIVSIAALCCGTFMIIDWALQLKKKKKKKPKPEQPPGQQQQQQQK